MTAPPRYPVFVKRDLDGFFGLFVDNLVQLLLIVALCGLAGIPAGHPLVVRAILPGAAVSVLIGNLFYAWQAHRLARREGRDDVTALPYGINTPSLIVYVFFVMKPAFDGALRDGLGTEGAAQFAWKMGLLACLGSGLIEFGGSFVAEAIRRRTPRAALLSTLAGIAIGFISMTFALQVYQRPLVGMLPLAVILVTYFARARFPLGLPGGLVAVLAGTIIAWTVPGHLSPGIAGPPLDSGAVAAAWQESGWRWPQLAVNELWDVLSAPSMWLGYLSVIVPMGLFNVLGSLQNIESAEAAGDRFDTRSSLAVNGVGTIAAALFGSCFPTTIYIGHPGWKGLGARAGYSTLNGIAISAICLTGTVTAISRAVPIEAGVAIVLWIGIIITAQAFQATVRDHAPAVAIGLFPAIAAWGATVMLGSFSVAGGATVQDVLVRSPATEVSGFLIHGMIVLERGYIFTCMTLAAITACLIDRKFFAAAAWSAIAAGLALAGLTHAYQLEGNLLDFLLAGTSPADGALSFRATAVVIGYGLFAVLFAAFGCCSERRTAGRTAQRTDDSLAH